MTCLNETFPTPFPDAKSAFPHNVTKTFRRAYYASVTWTDFLIGELLDTLEDAGVANNTIVALLGDHGWQLGEHNIWGEWSGSLPPFQNRVQQQTYTQESTRTLSWLLESL